MSVSLLCMSHTPLMAHNEPAPGVRAEIDALLQRGREFVAEVDPTLVVSFGPDHYHGFFHDLMPPFALCFAGSGIGDFGTTTGSFNVPEAIADGLLHHALDRGIDLPFSRQTVFDHGAVQVPELLFGSLDTYPTVPIFINGVAEPFGPVRRIRKLGHVLGEYLATLDERVLVIGSGGLSHDPPVPRWDQAPEPVRQFLLAGRNAPADARAAREARVIQSGLDFAAGTAPIAQLNPEWDQTFLELCASGDLASFDTWTPDRMTAEAGHSSHEVRCWIAAFAALAASGPYTVADRYYRAIPEWIAGFGFLTARTA